MTNDKTWIFDLYKKERKKINAVLYDCSGNNKDIIKDKESYVIFNVLYIWIEMEVWF